MQEAITNEVNKLIYCNLIYVDPHPEWLSSIVPGIKKNGKFKICIDF